MTSQGWVIVKKDAHLQINDEFSIKPSKMPGSQSVTSRPFGANTRLETCLCGRREGEAKKKKTSGEIKRDEYNLEPQFHPALAK